MKTPHLLLATTVTGAFVWFLLLPDRTRPGDATVHDSGRDNSRTLAETEVVSQRSNRLRASGAGRAGGIPVQSNSAAATYPNRTEAPAGSSPETPPARRRFSPAPAAARLPLIFAVPPEEVTGLNERQAAAAIAIADQFYDSIGGEKADPATPDYANRWKREQPLADYQLRAAIGAQAYARWQEEAYLRAKRSAFAAGGK